MAKLDHHIRRCPTNRFTEGLELLSTAREHQFHSNARSRENDPLEFPRVAGDTTHHPTMRMRSLALDWKRDRTERAEKRTILDHMGGH